MNWDNGIARARATSAISANASGTNISTRLPLIQIFISSLRLASSVNGQAGNRSSIAYIVENFMVLMRPIARNCTSQAIEMKSSRSGSSHNIGLAVPAEIVATSPDFAKRFTDAGQLKSLAVADTKRHVLLPNVPTTAEAGFPGIVAIPWFGFLGPTGLPTPIVQRLTKEIETVMSDTTLRQRMLEVGAIATFVPPEPFAKLMQDDLRHWDTVVKKAKIPLQD